MSCGFHRDGPRHEGFYESPGLRRDAGVPRRSMFEIEIEIGIEIGIDLSLPVPQPTRFVDFHFSLCAPPLVGVYVKVPCSMISRGKVRR